MSQKVTVETKLANAHTSLSKSLTDAGMNASDINATLNERGANYGVFAEHARISQNIKNAMRDSPNWEKLPADMKEALDMYAHKAARILNGKPDHLDSWHDMIGYTKLVEDRLNGIVR